MSTQDSNSPVVVPTMEDVKRAIEEHAASRNHPYATQVEPGFVTLSNKTDSGSEITVATSKAVKKAYDLANTANQNALNNNSNLCLEKKRNGADIPDKAEFVRNLGLSELVYRTIGHEPNQIPDMNNFESKLDESGYQKLPSGLIIQWGTAYGDIPQYAHDGWVQSSSGIEFPIQFPNKCVSLACSLIDGGTEKQWVAIAQVIHPKREGASLLIHTLYMPTWKPAATYIAVGY
ncbi:tail fiber protein [Xenorhabdus sp. SGI246]|uniref:gp53-like domain-containing protein n=1 Tax=Xenorhabdus sp. SGI246 TaxID=3158263 RepID=UPI00349F91F2